MDVPNVGRFCVTATPDVEFAVEIHGSVLSLRVLEAAKFFAFIRRANKRIRKHSRGWCWVLSFLVAAGHDLERSRLLEVEKEVQDVTFSYFTPAQKERVIP